jgi:hypothetical protein
MAPVAASQSPQEPAMSFDLRPLAPLCILASGLAISTAANAALVTKYSYASPTGTCQLSIPTTDTQVRPKASGFRNESSTNAAFVICGYGKPSTDGSAGNLKSIEIGVASLDGVSRVVKCTAVVGRYGSSTLVYSTKSLGTNIYNTAYIDSWTPADFGGGTYITNSYEPSVTCTLPPQTTIVHTGVSYDIDIGN